MTLLLLPKYTVQFEKCILMYNWCRWLSDSDGRCGRLVRQVAQILEGTRVAKDGTNRPVVTMD